MVQLEAVERLLVGETPHELGVVVIMNPGTIGERAFLIPYGAAIDAGESMKKHGTAGASRLPNLTTRERPAQLDG